MGSLITRVPRAFESTHKLMMDLSESYVYFHNKSTCIIYSHVLTSDYVVNGHRIIVCISLYWDNALNTWIEHMCYTRFECRNLAKEVCYEATLRGRVNSNFFPLIMILSGCLFSKK